MNKQHEDVKYSKTIFPTLKPFKFFVYAIICTTKKENRQIVFKCKKICFAPHKQTMFVFHWEAVFFEGKKKKVSPPHSGTETV